MSRFTQILHIRNTISPRHKCLMESSSNPQNKCKCNEHKDLFYRSSDSPRAPMCESYSPLRKLVVIPRSSYLPSPLYDNAPSWRTIAAATNLPLLTTTLGASRRHLAIYEPSSKSNKCFNRVGQRNLKCSKARAQSLLLK